MKNRKCLSSKNVAIQPVRFLSLKTYWREFISKETLSETHEILRSLTQKVSISFQALFGGTLPTAPPQILKMKITRHTP